MIRKVLLNMNKDFKYQIIKKLVETDDNKEADAILLEM